MKTILNPDLFHGNKKKLNFFEGWYFKIVDKKGLYKLAIIPGIALGNKDLDHHSFIQVVDCKNIKYNYIKFKKSDFSYDNTQGIFNVSILSNEFSLSHMNLNLVYIDSNKKYTIKGSLEFTDIFKWNGSILNPGSMGFYNYLNFMECYAQVCALDGNIIGSLNINGEEIDFTGGSVYIEKNWGSSFPRSWVWIQSNDFDTPDVSITCSLATIPFPVRDFKGFLIGLRIKDKFYKFTTINRSKLTIKQINNDMNLVITNKNYKLTLHAHSNIDDFVLCYGPKNGHMVPMVKETLCANVDVILEDTKNNTIIFNETGRNTGVEYGGSKMFLLN